MTEQRLSGFQDPKLEIRPDNRTRSWREKSTPTKDGDISERARAYKRMMHSAADHKQIIAGSDHDTTQDVHRQSSDALRSIRHDVVVMGFNLTAFDMMVRDEVTLREQKAAEEAEDERIAAKPTERERDWFIINQEFPNQFDRQAELGDVPPVQDIVNFGNHAHKKADAGGFEPRRRGW